MTLVSRKQRLRELETKIRGGLEAFCYTGMMIKEIRDEYLYKEDGFESWEDYCKERFSISSRHALRLIMASEYRRELPSGVNGSASWSETSVRELTRIPDKKQAARVAAKVVKAVEQSEKQAAADPAVKPMRLTAETVKRYVNEDLGITKKPTENADIKALGDYLSKKCRAVDDTRDFLKGLSDDVWFLVADEYPQLMKRFITASNSLAAFLLTKR